MSASSSQLIYLSDSPLPTESDQDDIQLIELSSWINRTIDLLDECFIDDNNDESGRFVRDRDSTAIRQSTDIVHADFNCRLSDQTEINDDPCSLLDLSDADSDIVLIDHEEKRSMMPVATVDQQILSKFNADRSDSNDEASKNSIIVDTNHRKRSRKRKIITDDDGAKDAKKNERELAKQMKAVEREKKLEESKKRKKLKQFNTDVKRVEREIRIANNTRCEHFLRTNIDCNIFTMMGAEFRSTLKQMFEQKDIDNRIFEIYQSIVPNSIVWCRDIIDYDIVTSSDSSSIPTVCRTQRQEDTDQAMLIITNDRFVDHIRNETLTDFVTNAKCIFGNVELHLTLVIYGQLMPKMDMSIYDVLLDLYENHQVQHRFVHNIDDLARLIYTLHRAIANVGRKIKLNERMKFFLSKSRSIKGQRRSNASALIADWWPKMLLRIPRITDIEQRTIVNAHPCPFALINDYLRINESDGRLYLADLQLIDDGSMRQRRIGPCLSTQIYHMLTSFDGNQLVNPNH